MLTSFARRCAAAAAAISGAVALPLAAAAPARADQVRQKQQWVLNALDVPAAWNVTKGRNVTVAVIDSGVDPTVSDLTGSVTTGPDLTGVGTPVSNPNWGQHGTWMASLIAGHGHGKGRQDGIMGVAPQARILSIRVITDRTDPGFSKYEKEPPSRGQHELATAIKYAVTHHASVISMSLGYDAASLAVRSALQFAYRHNVVVVASSGNSGTPQTARGQGNAPYSFPADYPGVIGVAAVSQSGQPAYFSSENLSVEVAAPGVNVPAQGRASKYWLVSGTSPACALTAGVAALIKSRYPHLTASQVRRAITESSVNRPPHGYDDQIGFGTVDAAAALRAAGRLARQIPASHSAAGKAADAGHFGNGLAGVPPLPVPPLGNQKLLILFGVAAGFLLVVIVSMWRFAAGLADRRSLKLALRRVPARPRAPAARGPAARGPAAPASAVPGIASPGLLQGAPVNVIYPPQAGSAQGVSPVFAAGQQVQGYPGLGYSSPGYAGPGLVGQEPTFGRPQPESGQPVFGQPAQSAPGQPAFGQPVASQPPFGQPVAGQPVFGQPLLEHGQPPFGQEGQPVAGQQPPFGHPQPLAGQSPLDQSQPVAGQPPFGQPVAEPGQPVFGQQGQPVAGQPPFGQPQPEFGQPVFGQPVFGQPQPAFGQSGQSTPGWPAPHGAFAQSGSPAQPGFGQLPEPPPDPGQARSMPPPPPMPSTELPDMSQSPGLGQAPAMGQPPGLGQRPGTAQPPGPAWQGDAPTGRDEQPLRPTLGQEYRSWVISESPTAGGSAPQGSPQAASQPWSPDQPGTSAFANPSPAQSPDPASAAGQPSDRFAGWPAGQPAGQPADGHATPVPPVSEAWRPPDLMPTDRYERPLPGQPGSSAGLPSVWRRVLPEQPTARRDAPAAGPADAAAGSAGQTGANPVQAGADPVQADDATPGAGGT